SRRRTLPCQSSHRRDPFRRRRFVPIMTAIIWSDEYIGDRWTYGLTYRPLIAGVANVPAGWLLGSDRPHPSFPFGTVQFPRPLTEREVQAFELTEVQP